MEAYRQNLIKRITDLPASLCPSIFIDYTKRGEELAQIEWNIDMLIDDGVPLTQLRDLCVLTETAAESTRLMK